MNVQVANEIDTDGIAAVMQLLEIVGEDPTRDGLIETPQRVVKALREMTSGYHEDPAAILSKQFEVGNVDEMVVVRGIEFTSLCEHHLLPFVGTATVAYVPKARVVGLSKLARLVDVFARRLQVQERLTREVAEALMSNVDAKGVGVVAEAQHACMSCRGVKKVATMVTSCLLGDMRDDAKMRAEFLSLARQ